MAIYVVLGGIYGGWIGLAWAGGCAPLPPGAAALPPCCATTDMRGGGLCVAPAAGYGITLFNLSLEKNDGTNVVFGAPRDFDAAAVNAGSVIGTYLSGTEIPAATYVALRATLGNTVALRVDTRTADGRRCTGQLTSPMRLPDGNAIAICAPGQPDGSTAFCRDGGNLKLRDARLGTVTINKGGSLALDLRFDVNNAVTCRFAPGQGDSTTIEPGILSLVINRQ